MQRKQLTAIQRTKPSLPMRYLQQLDLVRGPALDYGCGYGYDAAVYDMYAYDPNYFPIPEDQLMDMKFETITCTYVLNVVGLEAQEEILNNIKDLLRPRGVAYIAVRRDIKGSKFGKGGSYQRNVVLDLPLVKENSVFAIYKYVKE